MNKLIIKYGYLILFIVFIGCGKNINNNAQNLNNTAKDSLKDNIKLQNEGIDNKYSIPFKMGETTVIAEVIDKKCEIPIKYFNMHENEVTSVQAGKRLMELYGGRLVKLKTKGNRNIDFKVNGKNYTVDPNRIFTPLGLKITLNNFAGYTPDAVESVTKFVNTLLDSLFKDSSQVIVALHNNTPGAYSVKSYMAGGEAEGDAIAVNGNNEMSIDDFFIVTEKELFDSLKARNYNVVLQNNEDVTDDGSLSVYCGRNKIRYINVEAQTLHLNEQTDMLEILYSVLKNIYMKK
ncbi:MAG TPA: hypothetical protein VIL99_09035 [Ignavibacteria bacterium]